MGQNLLQKHNHEIAERVTPLGQVREALEYYCSGVVTEQHLRLSLEGYAASPVYFLLGHSIELSLKSLLRKKGMGPDEYRRKPLGHDLCNCLLQVEKSCVKISEALSAPDRGELARLNEYYSNKAFEYFGHGGIDIPEFEAVRRLAHTVLTVAINEIPSADGHLRGRLGAIFEEGI